jgi:hypothetical protein
MALDPIATSGRIEASYSRYLRTTLRPRDAHLEKQLEDLLLLPDHRLGKGPILQASTPYERGATIRNLVENDILNTGFLDLAHSAFPIDRPLYAHQENAIRHIVNGSNALVATGTGSGKTESFLIPILNHLLGERNSGSLPDPGVRALLLYPMNALANDQVKRLRQMFEAFPDITYGRYTGETEHEESKALDQYRSIFGTDPLPNELISRQSMKERPPHVLITNFAMLEYLLLRPSDSPFFDGPSGRHWKFIALDEIHTYDGSKGAEIAYLLRRVRDRVVESEKGRIQYIGTSATLGSGSQDDPLLVDFAHAIFDEQFDQTCLIKPLRISMSSGDTTWIATEELTQLLLEHVNSGTSPQSLAEFANSIGIPPFEVTTDIPGTLFNLLIVETHIQNLRSTLALNSIDIYTAVSDLNFSSTQHLINLVELACKAVDAQDTPLLPARYHFLLRALEGAFICIDEGHPSRENLFLDRHLHCPACAQVGRLKRLFEFGACRRCGSSFVLGNEQREADNGPSVLAQAGPYERKLVHLLLGQQTVEDNEDDEIFDEAEEESPNSEEQVLCSSCGAYGTRSATSRCCDQPSYTTVTYAKPGKNNITRKCPACSGSTTYNIVFRFLSGVDASGSVIASSLYQDIPIDPNPRPSAIAGGRKLLTFSDSRQEAAYFAPYFDRTHSRAIQRRLIWETLRQLKESDPSLNPRPEDLVTRLVTIAREFSVFTPDSSPLSHGDLARTWIFSEIISHDSAINLEGTGIASIMPVIPEGLKVPEGVIPHGLNDIETLTLILQLLSTLRDKHIVTPMDGVSLTDEIFSPLNFEVHIRGQNSTKYVAAWEPKPNSMNSRLDIIERTFAARNSNTNARDWLKIVWGWLTSPDSPWSKVLASVPTKGGIGAAWQLNPKFLEFHLRDESTEIFTCSRCRNVQWSEINQVCTRYRCTGHLQPISHSLDDNHYRHQYMNLDPIPAIVEEHTAQLGNKEAAKRQAQFVNGEINVLSCSTTFELGVDVGEIQTVFLRNMPPGPANYVQRAGRAGRRAGSPALTVTFAQRKNHDQHFFRHPAAMIDGHVSAPIVEVINDDIARRHVHSIALAQFLRYAFDRWSVDPRSVEDFFIQEFDGCALSEHWRQWLISAPVTLQQAVKRVLPPALQAALGVDHWGWVHELINPPTQNGGGSLWVSEDDVKSSLAALTGEIDRLVELKKFNIVANIQKVEKTIKNGQYLSQLSRRTVLPKYGFPVDSVPFDLSKGGIANAARLDLDRDLTQAIVDYAPGSQIVADKRIWESEGVKIPNGLQLRTYEWRECKECNSLTSKLFLGEELIDSCSACGSSKSAGRGKFIWPEFGFIGNLKGNAGEQRPIKVGYAKPYFVDYQDSPESEQVIVAGKVINVLQSRLGEVHLVNQGSGRGFCLCRSCGRMESIPPSNKKGKLPDWKHTRPGTSHDCNSRSRDFVSLGHQYRTDVLEIRLGISGSWNMYQSTLQALVAALPSVGIKREDVQGMMRFVQNEPPALLLVDAVPGGAGHAKRIRQMLPPLITAALARTENCNCGLDSSCYACLRAYDNQQIQELLVREDAIKILRNFS